MTTATRCFGLLRLRFWFSSPPLIKLLAEADSGVSPFGGEEAASELLLDSEAFVGSAGMAPSILLCIPFQTEGFAGAGGGALFLGGDFSTIPAAGVGLASSMAGLAAAELEPNMLVLRPFHADDALILM